ncbi:MAG: PcfJ domain-containing protein [Oscillospiraceae bacterium]|nr:PcfJ domain-containing protein [Oscillospiraceae bacterium]
MRKARKEELLRIFPAVPEEIADQMKGRGAENFAVMLTHGRELFVRCYHRYSSGKLAERQRYVFAEDGSVRYGIDNNGIWRIRKEFREPVFYKTGYGYNFYNKYTILNRKALTESCMKYSQIEYYQGNLVMEYLHLYCKHRNLEYLMKSGYVGVVEETYTYSGFFRGQEHLSIAYPINWRSNNLLKMLNLNRTEFKILQGNEEHYLDFLSWREALPDYKPEELLTICKAFGSEHGTAEHFCKLTGLKLKRIARYLVKNEIYSHDYQDYLDQCKKLRYNLHDTAINMPHHFAEMHERLTEIIQYKASEAIRQHFAERIPERKKLEFQDGNLIICQPSSMDNIIAEGKTLQHCVAGYAERHAKGCLHILFIRKAGDPDKPFYTIEVRTDGKIVQVRGYKNCNPTPEVAEFVEKYKVYLQAVFGKQKLMESAA